MDGLFGSFFSGSKKDKSSDKIINEEETDDNRIKINESSDIMDNRMSNSLSFLCTQNFNRERFPYKLLMETQWWPDEILEFIQVCRISYIEFINSFSNEAEVFDEPIRNLIFYMIKKPYSLIPTISKYVKNGRYEIPDKYLNYVIQEDNCYMDEYEERSRSKQETKHNTLCRAIEKMLSISPIKYNKYKLDQIDIDFLRIYIIIYNLKSMYVVTDNILRSTLKNFLINGYSLEPLQHYFNNLRSDIDSSILDHLHKLRNISTSYCARRIFHCLHTFRDLINYGHYRTSVFRSVFDLKRPSPTELDAFDSEMVNRIHIVYCYYSEKLEIQQKRQTMILKDSTNFSELMKSKYGENNTASISYKYTLKNTEKDDRKQSSIFLVDDWILYQSFESTRMITTMSDPDLRDPYPISQHRKYRSKKLRSISETHPEDRGNKTPGSRKKKSKSIAHKRSLSVIDHEMF